MPAASVVDYEAWRKGYMPPAEHVLIHELSHQDATVKAAAHGGDFSWWLVVKGKPSIEDLEDIAAVIVKCLEIEKRRAKKAVGTAQEETTTTDQS